MKFLPRAFFARDTVSVAQELVGCGILRRIGDGEIMATIVEVEAYLGENDPASHAYRGPTPRNGVMFGPAGHLYVYLSYGVHYCANIVTESEGVAGAVLLRAAHVERGVDLVQGLRAPVTLHSHLLRGPGNLGKGLGLTRAENGTDLCSQTSPIHVVARESSGIVVVNGPRIGITKAADEPLRYWWSDHPAVSRPRS